MEKRGPLQEIVLEEISLEGLEGITIDDLWTRLSAALNISLPIVNHIKKQVWNFILENELNLSFYELPKAREKLKLYNRKDLIDHEYGLPFQPDENPTNSYKYSPIEIDGIRGSSEFYYEQKNVSFNQIKLMNLDEIIERWGDKLIIVASQNLREKFLFERKSPLPINLPILHYCVLEKIGRSRTNGEVTVGKHSLLHFINDSSLIFYIRNKLIKRRLILKQQYLLRIGPTILNGYLLTLPRYFTEFKTKTTTIIDNIIKVLEEQKDNIIPCDKAKELLNVEYDNTFRKICKTIFFRKIISTEYYPFRKFYPDANEKTWRCKTTKEEKQIRCFKLKPQAKFEFSTKKVNGVFEKHNLNFLSFGKNFVDMPLIQQIYLQIKKSGKKGITSYKLKHKLGLTRLYLRQLLGNMKVQGYISSYLKDEGRQRLQMFVINSTANPYLSSMKDIQVSDVTEQEMENPSEISINEENDPEIENINLQTFVEDKTMQINVEINECDSAGFKWLRPKDEISTQKQKNRQKIIREAINKFLVLSQKNLINIIKKAENSLPGLSGKIDRKSLIRHLTWLAESKLIKIFHINLNMENYQANRKLYCNSSIDRNHEMLHKVINRLKAELSCKITTESHRAIVGPQDNLNRKKKKLVRLKPISYPKFLRARFVHELLFYLIHELDRHTKKLPYDNVIKMWQEEEPNISFTDLKTELPDIFSPEISWKMFIPPLPSYDRYKRGWGFSRDLLDRLPLIHYVKVCGINKDTHELLEKYLEHPIRRYYLINHLPEDMQESLLVSQLQYNYFHNALKILAMLGLVQFGHRYFKSLTKLFIYCNLNAKIIDTTLSEPGYLKISSNIEYPTIEYNFKTMEDIEKYWFNLYNICMTTNLGRRKDRVVPKYKYSEYSAIPTDADVDVAISRDIGYIPGDNLGAGGLDSQMISFLKKNWCTVKKKKCVSKKKQFDKVPYKELMKKIKNNKSKKKVVVVGSIKDIEKRKILVPKVKSQKATYDSIDKKALSRMNKLRCKWTPAEDRLLLVIRVAIEYFHSNTRGRYVNSYTFRDILHWHLGSLDKTSKACQRRMVFIMKKKYFRNIYKGWYNILRQHPKINRLYGQNFFKDIKKIKKNLNKRIQSAKIHFIVFLRHIIEVLNATKHKSGFSQIQLPNTINDYKQNYINISQKEQKNKILYKNPKNKTEADILLICATIHSSVCCNKDKTLYNVQLFQIYKNFDEEVLNKALEKVRNEQLVVVAKFTPNTNLKILPLSGNRLHISSVYRFKMFQQLPYDIILENFNILQYMLNVFFDPNNEIKSITYKIMKTATCFTLAEFTSTENFSIKIETPKQILRFDPSQEDAAKDAEKVINHFREIFNMSMQPDYVKKIPDKTITECSKNNVKFNCYTDAIKIKYNAFDFISKLNNFSIHFFCFLNCINETINVEVENITYDRPCLDNCLLNDSNYLEIIQKLSEKYDETFDNITTIEEHNILKEKVFTITTTNIFNIFNVYRNKYNDLIKDLNRKDYGKNNVNKDEINIIGLIKALACSTDIDDFDNFEFEQIYNKEDLTDKVRSLQDIFIVNVPTLHLSYTLDDDTELINFNGLQVPKSLVKPIQIREKILEKVLQEALWKPTDTDINCILSTIKKNENSSNIFYNAKNILQYIENYEFGVDAQNLLGKFGNEEDLVKSVKLLRKYNLVKRYGADSYVYVHRRHVRNFLIESYHIKRLQKESLKSLDKSAFKRKEVIANLKEQIHKKKRKCSLDIINTESWQGEEQQDEDDNQQKTETTPKNHQTNDRDHLIMYEKRVSKNVERYSDNLQREQNIDIEEKNIIYLHPSPWIRINGSLNRRVLDKWLGTILNNCIIHTGQKFLSLCYYFNQLTPVNILTLLKILRELECLKIRCYSSNKKQNLYSEYDDLKISDATEFTKLENIFIIVEPQGVTKLGVFIGNKNYKIDFS